MKEVVMSVIKYESLDGNIYDTEKECQLRDDIHKGIARICPNCNGKGEEIVEDWGYRNYEQTCRECNGKGHQYKKETWE